MYEDIYRERFYPFRFCAETKQAFRQAVTVPALSMWSFQMVCGRGTTCIYQVVGQTGDGGDREVPPQLRMTWRNNTACRHTILWRPFKSGVPWTGGWKQEQVEMDLIQSHLERRQVKYRISTTSHPVGHWLAEPIWCQVHGCGLGCPGPRFTFPSTDYYLLLLKMPPAWSTISNTPSLCCTVIACTTGRKLNWGRV